MDVAALQRAVVSDLPRRSRWLIDGTPMDYKFYTVPMSMAALSGSDDDLLKRLIAFGEYDFAEGGGARPWLVVDSVDARVFLFDDEADDDDPELRLLNSCFDAFVRTFRLLDAYLGRGRRVSADTGALVEAWDPRAYASSEWRKLVDHLTQA
jgi:hypothetical protein